MVVMGDNGGGGEEDEEAMPLRAPEDCDEHPEACVPGQPQAPRFALSDGEVDAFVREYVLVHDSLNFDLIPDALEAKMYAGVVQVLVDVVNATVVPALVALQQLDVCGHHIAVDITKAKGLEVERAFNDGLSRECVDEFVSGLLLSKHINIKAVPDTVERAVYRNVITLALQLIRHFLTQIKIVFLDHELQVDFDPIPHFTPAPFVSRLDKQKVGEAVHKLMRQKNSKWVPDSIEYFLHFSAHMALLSLLEHVLVSMDARLFTTNIRLSLQGGQAASPAQVKPPIDEEVEAFVKAHVLDSERVKNTILPDSLEGSLYGTVVWTVLQPVLDLTNGATSLLSQLNLWDHSLAVAIEPLAQLPDTLLFDGAASNKHITALVNDFLATKYDLAVVPDAVERALYTNCLKLAMELLHHVLCQVKINAVGHCISFNLRVSNDNDDDPPASAPSHLSEPNIHFAADAFARKNNVSWVPNVIERYLSRSVFQLLVGWLERAVQTSRVRLVGWEFAGRLVPTKGYVKRRKGGWLSLCCMGRQ